ncbi:hypothetical protein V5P93_004705 [Actinokineospora auranticolor]|uniref:Uncharacterized protein n=1 Tax=Actinokineospora auranticolor TaxID=155976 RepID=A0A2S6GN68_9PSEU|nr:hypothetical protein [Actinokineospora auranticolor]PPK66668.1 hypothetical protein CLV40_10953 [Actinokineospora auranticolor]
MTLRRTAIAAATLFTGLSAFQLALALGAPLGRAAWGGTRPDLPAGLRVASAVAVVVWACAAVVVLRRGEVLARPGSPRLIRRLTWALVVLMAIGALMNAASPSPWERFGWSVFGLVQTALCVVLTRAKAPVGARA